MFFQITTLVILIILSALFSGIETAMMSVSLIKAKALSKQKKRGGRALYRLKKNPHRMIITILIGNNLVNVASAALATVIFTEMFGSSGIGIATGIMTFLILVFGEITPKTYAIKNSKRLSLAAARPLELLSNVLWPIVRFFEIIAHAMSRILGSKKEKKFSKEDLIEVVAMGEEEGILSKDTAEIMHNLLKFETTKVSEIMTPIENVMMIDGSKKLKDALDFIVKSSYSRFPVYGKTKDNVVGILDVDDVLKYTKNNDLNANIKKISRRVRFVSESKDIDDLLTEFEGKKIPIAVVINSRAKVVGLVTVEDVLEEIVGDIFDKSKKRYL
ncbi:hemolysin family protein [Candidatus Aenigmatarchaeota archaeon]